MKFPLSVYFSCSTSHPFPPPQHTFLASDFDVSLIIVSYKKVARRSKLLKLLDLLFCTVRWCGCYLQLLVSLFFSPSLTSLSSLCLFFFFSLVWGAYLKLGSGGLLRFLEGERKFENPLNSLPCNCFPFLLRMFCIKSKRKYLKEK